MGEVYYSEGVKNLKRIYNKYKMGRYKSFSELYDELCETNTIDSYTLSDACAEIYDELYHAIASASEDLHFDAEFHKYVINDMSDKEFESYLLENELEQRNDNMARIDKEIEDARIQKSKTEISRLFNEFFRQYSAEKNGIYDEQVNAKKQFPKDELADLKKESDSLDEAIKDATTLETELLQQKDENAPIQGEQ